METNNEGNALAQNGLTMSSDVCVNEHPENSPSSSTHQEVNKPLVEVTSGPGEQEKSHSHSDTDSTEKDNSDKLNLVSKIQPDEESKKKKKAKSVKFPNDSTIIKGYLEAHDPWKNVPDWRTEDLIRAYKRDCEAHGTKPLIKLLQQLQCIENVGERYEILSLKGERLDIRQCESLESILKHVRFRCIDLEATHLDDEMAVALFEMVEFYESALKVNISFNKNIGPRGWMSCARLVRKTPCLTFIDAHNCDLNERVIPIMGRALRMGCFLARLHLQNTNLAGRALMILVAAVKMNETLKELFLGDNKFMPTDGVQLGNLLKYNNKLELLDLRNNHLQDVGAGHICDGLSEQTLDTGLLTLVLWNNQITFQSMPAFNKALLMSEHLETLNLGHNPVTNEGIHVLKDGLLKTRTLLKLGLSGTKVTCEGAVALAEVIADSPRLVRLDLQENEIKTAGLMALSLALKVNESLTRLDLDRETKRESGMKDYADQQKRLRQDISALLDRNRDIAHKFEAKKQEIELKNQENARKLAEAAKDLELSQAESSEYIPSEDTIHRPKLLFLPYGSPERDLDSPVTGSEFFQVASPNLPNIQLSTPASELLSPQYCPDPKVTAKKIFSVSRVLSPQLSSPDATTSFIPQVEGQPGLPIVQLCPPLVSVDLPDSASANPLTMNLDEDIVSPNRLQKALEEQTLVSMIQQIVGETSTTTTTTACTSNSDSDLNIPHSGESDVNVSSVSVPAPTHKLTVKSTVSLAEGDASVVISALNHSLNAAVADHSESAVNGVGSGEHSADSGVEIDNVQTGITGTDSADVMKSDTSLQSCDIGRDGHTEDSVSGVSDLVSDDSKGDVISDNSDSSSNIPANEDTTLEQENTDVVVNEENQLHCENNTDRYASISDKSSHCIEHSNKSDSVMDTSKQTRHGEVEGELNGDYVDCEPSLDEADFETLNEEKEVISDIVDNTGPPAKGDLEQWNTVNEAEIVDSNVVTGTVTAADDNGNTSKPDFFSNLSLNGMKQELASLIDDEGNPTLVGAGVAATTASQ